MKTKIFIIGFSGWGTKPLRIPLSSKVSLRNAFLSCLWDCSVTLPAFTPQPKMDSFSLCIITKDPTRDTHKEERAWAQPRGHEEKNLQRRQMRPRKAVQELLLKSKINYMPGNLLRDKTQLFPRSRVMAQTLRYFISRSARDLISLKTHL